MIVVVVVRCGRRSFGVGGGGFVFYVAPSGFVFYVAPSGFVFCRESAERVCVL
jgi:hypothetical protein